MSRNEAALQTPAQLLNVLPALQQLARDAGRAAMAFYDAPQAEIKADGSPLTLADLASHRVISEGLPAILGVPVLSEESADHSREERQQWPEFWLVDPIDGTKEFIKKTGDFTVNIAFISEGAPVLGVVFAPVPNLMYSGVVGCGAWRQTADDVQPEPIQVAGDPQPGELLQVVASVSHRTAALEQFLARLGPHEAAARGSSLKLCMVADGSAHVYPRIGPTCEWDTGAADAVVRAAGGQVTDLAGTALRYGKADILNPHFVVDGSASQLWQAGLG